MLYQEIATFVEIADYGHLRTKEYKKEQLGFLLSAQKQEWLNDAEIVLLGCGERRGMGANAAHSCAANIVREQLYELYNWHTTVRLFDAGNIIPGNSLQDSRVALGAVLETLHRAGKTVVLIGGSHDLTMQQYEAYKRSNTLADITVVDMLVDLQEDESITHNTYLFDMLTSIPNFVRNFNLLGFQSFATSPSVLQTLDKLLFECTRLGKLRGDIEEAEPIIRRSHIVSVDINCIKHSDAPANVNGSPNGLHGPEACTLTEYAGLSENCTSLGIFGFNEEDDQHDMTAKQIAHMIWYFFNGRHYRAQEVAPNKESDVYEQYTVLFDNDHLLFYKNKHTARWWMLLPSGQFYPVSYKDYQKAMNGELSAAIHKELAR
jgi:formiminoglutamase